MSKKKISLDKIESNDPAVVSLKVNEKDLKTYGGCKPLVNALVKNTVLSTLDLSENRLGDTSEELFILLEKNQGITNLDVSYNGFSQQFASRIAKEIRKNFTIQHFHLEESASKRALGKKPDPRIREIQQDIDNVAAQNTQFSLCQIKKADTLSFTNRNFRVVPKIIDTVPHITELDLSYNLLSVFPRELTQLSALERLILNHNQITAIQTTQLPELRNLTELDLSYNLLSEIPFSLNYLPLQVLDVSHNLLATTYCFPNVLFGERGVDITASGNYAALHSQCSIIGRLFFLGDRKSGIFKLISLLEGIQLMHDAFKHIPNEKKNHIRGQQSLHNRSSNIRIDHWFPVSKFSVEKKAKRNQNAVPQRVRLKKLTAGRTHSLNRSLSPESGTMGEHVPIVRAATCTDTRMIPQYRKSGSLEGFISSSPPSIDSSYVCHQLSCWLFDPVTVHIHPLFVSGSHNHIPFVIAFQLTQNIQEMTDSVMYLIQSIYSTTSSKNPTFFLVGTYKQDFEKRRKIAKSVFNNVKQLFANKAKLFFMSVNLQTCHKVKELSTQIIRELSAQAEGLIFPQLPSVISEPWFERCKLKLFGLYEHINAIREDIVNCLLDSLEIEKSVLRWLEFSKLCREFSFPKEEHEFVATLLRHVGTIHHYRDVDGEKSFCDFIFLQPDVLVHHYTKILQSFSNYKVSLHENSVLCAISKATIVQDIWTLLPKTFHEPFLELYEYYGQLFCIHDGLFLVAGDFQPLPNNFAFDQFPEWKSGMGELGSRYITRCYSFDEMNDVGYCKIVTAFHRLITKYNVSYRKLYLKTIHQHSFDIELREVDKTGLEIHCQGLPSERVIGFARVNYDYTRSCVTLFADEISEQREFFCAMAEALESLFSSDTSFKRSKEPVHAMCVCATCRSEQSKLHRKMWTSLSWLESIAEAGTAFAYCGDLAVRIDLLAPDITLSKVTNKVVEYSSLNIIQKIGEGAHSTVFYATKGKKEVAVKKLFTSADETYSSFRKEVSLMAGLRNPNCVGLVGVCKQPLCVLTEYCLFGDLFSYIESRRERNLPLPIPFILDVLIDVAKGMRFLHSTSPPVLHRDLKSPNILLCRTAPDEEQAENPFPKPDYLIEDHVPSPETAKVADFGLSLQIHGAITKREVDNPLWLAPELLAKEPYSLASDVYAFGIVISEMFSLQIPYETYSYKFVSQLEDYIISGGRPDIAENTPQSMKDLIEKCWHTNAKERPSFQDIVVRLEEIHEEFPTLHKSSTWSETKVKEFKRGAASTKKKRNRKQERRKYSKDIIDTLLKDEELEYLILSHSPTSGNEIKFT